MSNQARARELAKTQKLAQLCFRDKNGNFARGPAVATVEIQYDNGEWVKLTVREFLFLGKDVKWKLMTDEDWEKSGLEKPIQ